MAHAYTPGLRATSRATVRRERRLPLKGRVLVRPGAIVEPQTVVARTELPGSLQTVNVAARLGAGPERVPEALLVPVGAEVREGDILARGPGVFGFGQRAVAAPADGTIESVSPVTGQVLLREPAVSVEVRAYVRGVVAEVLPDEGVVVETRGALLQGIFGVGGETWGPMAMAVEGPDAQLTPARLRAEHRGHVVVGGAHVTFEALARARELGVAAVVAGGLDDVDLRRLLGRDLGVAITGAEAIGLTVVLTEGFGHIRMSDRAWALLAARAGRLASVSGATQIRAGVLRPEVLVPDADGDGGGEDSGVETGLTVGSVVRVIRAPHFGRVGRVIEMPADLHVLESETRVRVLGVAFPGAGAPVLVPRANVEIIAS